MKYGVSINDFAYLADEILQKIHVDADLGDEWCKSLPREQQDMYAQCLMDIVPYVWLRFDKGWTEKKVKEDGSHATDMDLDIEGYLTEYFLNGFNVDNWRNVDIVSEETGLTHSESDRYICIDPVDGTHNMENWQKNTFPMFFASIAFVENGKTIFSLLINPESVYFVCKSHGFLKFDRELKFSQDHPVERDTCPLIGLTGVDLFKDMAFVEANAHNIRISYCTVLDIFNCAFKTYMMAVCYGCKEWDWRGAVLLAEELGCKVEIKKISDTYYEYDIRNEF